MDEWLVGGRVQRVRVAQIGVREVVLLQVRVPARSGWVVVAAGLGVGVLDREAYDRLRAGLEGDFAARRAFWRARTDGARLAGISGRHADFAREGKVWRAETRPGSESISLQAVDKAPRPVSASADDDLLGAGRRIAEALTAGATSGYAASLRRAVAKATARVRRRRDAVLADLARAHEADEKARAAEAFVGEAARAPRGATKLVTVDWSEGVAREAVFPLDPARGAREQLEAMFRKARRLREGARIAKARLDEAEASIAALSAVAEALSGSEEGLAELEARARAAAPRDFASSPRLAPRDPSRGAREEPAPPYRTYLSTSGARILVGRGADKNDELTVRVARPHDLWLHAKGRAGAHVLVPLAKGTTCPADVLVEAAHLAAHFSQAKNEAAAEIQYTPRRYVRKPKGSPPGLVVVDREKVLILRRDEALLRRVLEREQR